MPWIYEQTTGKLFTPTGIYAATGYAGGNCGKNPEGKNNPDMQNVKSIGPLPCGLYRMGEVIQQSHLGPFAIPLFPDPNNEMFGRGSFYVHGDTNPPGNASEGCIIQARVIREKMYSSDDKQIQVVATKE